MLKVAELELSVPGGRWLPPSAGSLLQGALMELLDSDLAASLHAPGLRPYSQYLFYRGSSLVWRVAALNEAAAQSILDPLLSERFTRITLRDKEATLTVAAKRVLYNTTYENLTDQFFLADQLPRRVILRFVTPASFRSHEKYMIYPSVEHILQNLYNRWNQFANRFSMADPDVLEHMAAHLRISGYRLEMAPFSLEGVRIPAFQGSLELSLAGPDALVRVTLLLLAYSEFAGIGIKTAIGMGGSTIAVKQRGAPLTSLLEQISAGERRQA